MFAILENGSVETMLRYRLRFSTGRAFDIPTGQSKSPDGLANARRFLRTSIAGRTMSIIESLLVLWRLVARAKQSAPSGGNGRRVISVDRPLRLRTAPRERPGCSPASLPPNGTSWPFIRCIGPDGPPVGGVQQLRLPWFSRKIVHLASGPERGVSGAAAHCPLPLSRPRSRTASSRFTNRLLLLRRLVKFWEPRA